MKKYMSPEWSEIFSRHHIDFNYLWNLKLEPLDKPNSGRGRNGWSSVSLTHVKISDKEIRRLIVKRQKNYASLNMLHPFRGIPTFLKEINNILKYKKYGIPTPEPVYYESRRNGKDIETVLVTEYLEGYTSLWELTRIWNEKGGPGIMDKIKIIKAVASIVREIHEKGIQHNSLYPKHIFISQDLAVKVIDLEKSRWRSLGDARRVRDLESLNRRSRGWSRADRLRFLFAYCGVDRMNINTEKLILKIIKRGRKKGKNNFCQL